MEDILAGLGSMVSNLSDQNYAQSFAFYRFWFDIGRTCHQISSDQIFDTIWDNRPANLLDPSRNGFVHSSAPLFLRFVSDAESDQFLAPQNSGLQRRLCARTLREFFDSNLRAVHDGSVGNLYADANLIARWANLGYVDEATIRNRILQSLISHQRPYDHQMHALIILFKLAGATFKAYADPSVVDRCLKFLDGHGHCTSVEWGLIQVLVRSRGCGLVCLPSLPVLAIREPEPTEVNQGGDPVETPVATPLGLPSGGLEPQISQPPPLESVTTPEADINPESPVTQSPTISIASLSDFSLSDTFDDELPTNPMEETPHEDFYLEDGNVEVLCGSTIFRVHTTILSFHSPVLCRVFSQADLAAAESPNGCPRIRSSDLAKDFTTLLKAVYLPGFPERNRVPDFATFSSLLRITAKYEMPTIQSQLLEVVRSAYPQNFEGLTPSKPLGEGVFSGPTPHPNEVLNLFIHQELTSALSMAYYMAARRGLDSLMDRLLSRNATLSPEVLQSAIRGLMALREVELNETRSLIFGPKGSRPCSSSNCPSLAPTGPTALATYRKVFNHIVGSSRLGTKVLQIPEFYEDRGRDLRCVGPAICRSCVERWEHGHAVLRKKVWAMFPDVFGLKD